MRVLNFIVNGQKLDKAENTDLSYIIRGSDNYLCLCIKFDDEWNNTAKIVSLYDSNKKETLKSANNGIVLVPKEITQGDMFSFNVVGRKSQVLLRTNRFYIKLRKEQ